MRLITSPSEMRSAARIYQRGSTQRTIGLVPTMGALHEGHLSLIRASRSSCDRTVATIFVNPLQFGPNEDFTRYPRTFDQDRLLLEKSGVDILFAPSPDEMYPTPMQTLVDVPVIGARLDGASREGHFRGVATVVCKLFQIVQPDCAFFGQKDAAQVAVLRAMVRDLNFDLELVVCPTVREADGLAMSSRNRYLTGAERTEALALSRSLRAVESAIAGGERSIVDLRETLIAELTRSSALRVDYAEIVNPDTLESVTELPEQALVAVAAWVGTTRLIDNALVVVEGSRA
ncbi:pantoate--beta-alanine ligase [Terriglobus roseus DSM 18391]|uniref:Pantothenate synthetase n=1 Tax=Terriglobus roseus (strain DSM 18391 / NRRL B-41598 / KBS 63) TaxID=926566 RepID=I3ZIP4_TERRK|nr:pantoate--beta-alanine ligase [Terriglobus roseus]AFL89112.1 pantoate--beta-alanine ligase [Terriglobus roseus DSM 18391]